MMIEIVLIMILVLVGLREYQHYGIRKSMDAAIEEGHQAITEARAAIAEAQTELDAQQLQNDTLTKSNERLLDIRDERTEQLEYYKGLVEEHEERIQKTERQLHEARTAHNQVVIAVDERDARINELEGKLTASALKRQEEVSEMRRLYESKLDALRTSLKSATTEAADLSSEVEEQNKVIERLRESVEQHLREVQAAEAVQQKLRDELAAAKLRQADFQNLIQLQQADVARLEDEKRILLQGIEQLELEEYESQTTAPLPEPELPEGNSYFDVDPETHVATPRHPQFKGGSDPTVTFAKYKKRKNPQEVPGRIKKRRRDPE